MVHLHRFWVKLLTLVMVSLPISSLAVNKCTDHEGRVSYQDGPCSSAQYTAVIKTEDASDQGLVGEVRSVLITVPGVGDVGVMSFRHWVARVSENGAAPTLRLRADAMSVQLTFVPRSEALIVDEDEQKANVRKMGQRFVGDSVEQGIHLRRLNTAIGPAILANFNDRKYETEPVPKGEFSSITIGQVDHELMSVAVTILTNGPDTEEHDAALTVLDSIVVIKR